MKHRSSKTGGHLARAIALVTMVTLAPLPVLAAEAGSGPKPKPGVIRASVARISVNELPKTTSAKRSGTRAAKQSGQGQDRSFFKTGPGILALAVMIAGTGYAIYSTQNDRIKSPGKE